MHVKSHSCNLCGSSLVDFSPNTFSAHLAEVGQGMSANDILADTFRVIQRYRRSGPFAEVRELHMSPATVQDFKRRYSPVAGPVRFELSGRTWLFGIPIVIDPRIPDGRVVPVPAFAVLSPVWSPADSVFALPTLSQRIQEVMSYDDAPDEAPGLTFQELLGEIDSALEGEA